MTEEKRQEILETYKWIKVKRHVDDQSMSLEERYKSLERHHKEETEFLIEFIRNIVKKTKVKSWIKVSEQLPEEGEMVNAYNVNTKTIYPELYFEEDKQKWYDENCVENGEYDVPPTHWCKRGKLPKLPII